MSRIEHQRANLRSHTDRITYKLQTVKEQNNTDGFE